MSQSKAVEGQDGSFSPIT